MAWRDWFPKRYTLLLATDPPDCEVSLFTREGTHHALCYKGQHVFNRVVLPGEVCIEKAGFHPRSHMVEEPLRGTSKIIGGTVTLTPLIPPLPQLRWEGTWLEQANGDPHVVKELTAYGATPETLRNTLVSARLLGFNRLAIYPPEDISTLRNVVEMADEEGMFLRFTDARVDVREWSSHSHLCITADKARITMLSQSAWSAKSMTLQAALAALVGNGASFMCPEGLIGRPFEPETLANAVCFLNGLNAVPSHYRYGDILLGHGLPIHPDKGLLIEAREYSDGEAIAIVRGNEPGWTPTYRYGWTPKYPARSFDGILELVR